MFERSLAGVLLIAMVGSSVVFFAMVRRASPAVSILELNVPEIMYYSDEEYQVVASLLARRDVQQLGVRLHWLRGLGQEALDEIRSSFSAHSQERDPLQILQGVAFLKDVIALAEGAGFVPQPLALELVVSGVPHRLVVFSLGPVQDLFMPDRIGGGEGQRPNAVGDYALLFDQSGELAGFYQGYPAFFYDVEQTLRSLEVGMGTGKAVFADRGPESSLPRLRDIPPMGHLNLNPGEGERVDLIVSIQGRSLRLWTPQLCVIEVLVDGDLAEARAFLIR